jgi:hypothetical protein
MNKNNRRMSSESRLRKVVAERSTSGLVVFGGETSPISDPLSVSVQAIDQCCVPFPPLSQMFGPSFVTACISAEPAFIYS